MRDGQEPEPSWEEAHAAFAAAEPAELVRPARKLRIVYQRVDGGWTATSPDLEGFEVRGVSLEEAKDMAAEDLSTFLDPAVELDEKEVVEVEAVVATDQPLPAYGGVRVDEPVLHDLAEAIQAGSLPKAACGSSEPHGSHSWPPRYDSSKPKPGLTGRAFCPGMAAGMDKSYEDISTEARRVGALLEVTGATLEGGGVDMEDFRADLFYVTPQGQFRMTIMKVKEEENDDGTGS